jgi:glycosyltransferase involved in cell wall biosynthesis
MAPYVDCPIDVVGGLLSRQDRTVAPLPQLPSGPFVMFAGDPAGHKGIDVLLSIWADSPPAPLVLATTRPVDRPLPSGVQVIHLDRAQMPAAWARAALAVVPSTWAEPFGMVAMESLAAGTPVVASDVGALPEVVRDGVDGLLVPPNDGTALRAALSALMDDAELRSRMAARALEGASRFSPDQVAARVEDVYGRVVAQRAGLGAKSR